MVKIGVLIPAYNEEEHIGSTIESVLRYTDDITVVNDGSTDDTQKIVERYPVTLLNNTGNKGLARTVKVGFEYMLGRGYDFAIKMDGDGQMRACIDALLGKKESAVNLLRDALSQGVGFPRLFRDIDMEPLQDYPPYLELIEPKK